MTDVNKKEREKESRNRGDTVQDLRMYNVNGWLKLASDLCKNSES